MTVRSFPRKCIVPSVGPDRIPGRGQFLKYISIFAQANSPRQSMSIDAAWEGRTQFRAEMVVVQVVGDVHENGKHLLGQRLLLGADGAPIADGHSS